jgi:hypothetical protein
MDKYGMWFSTRKSLISESHDNAIRQTWLNLEDIQMKPAKECLEESFLHFPADITWKDIRHWLKTIAIRAAVFYDI